MCSCRSGSVKVEMTLVTEGSHQIDIVRRSIVNETQGGSLSEFVDPNSVTVGESCPLF